MNKVYARINWENYPSENTPLNESNLNKIDYGLNEVDNRVIELDTTKVSSSSLSDNIKSWSIDETTGIITIEKYSGEKVLFDLNIEKIPVSFSLSDDGILTMTTDDGTQFTADIGSMIPVLTFNDSETIAVSVTGTGVNKTYSFSIKTGSVTGDMLETNYLSNINVKVAEAEGYANTSSTNATESGNSATLSESWAVGGTGIRDGENTNNAKYYAEQAAAVSNVEIATTEKAGLVKPDGTTITVDADGTIHGNASVIVDSEFSTESKNPLENSTTTVKFNEVDTTLNSLYAYINHNIPRLIPKDITPYYQDGSLWDRLNGTNGYSFLEDIFAGDYIKMSRPISAYEQTQTYQTTGSQYVTIAGINTLLGNGNNAVNYNHLVMVPGQGFGGTQHFGKSRMDPANTTVGGYVGSEMHTTTIGAIATEGSTETTATINQQLYAEFGSHLKTTRELLSNEINSTGYNRFGSNTGCSNNWIWTDCQAVLMGEIEVYGSIVWSSSGYDIGTAKVQLPLFANNKYAMNNISAWYFLKDVASATSFCSCSDNGNANFYSASRADCYVRPRFVIAA